RPSSKSRSNRDVPGAVAEPIPGLQRPASTGPVKLAWANARALWTQLGGPFELATPSGLAGSARGSEHAPPPHHHQRPKWSSCSQDSLIGFPAASPSYWGNL